MTNVRNMTLAEFSDMVEAMRNVYPFRNEDAKIIDTRDDYTNTHRVLTLFVKDKKNGVDIRMSKHLPEQGEKEADDGK